MIGCYLLRRLVRMRQCRETVGRSRAVVRALVLFGAALPLLAAISSYNDRLYVTSHRRDEMLRLGPPPAAARPRYSSELEGRNVVVIGQPRSGTTYLSAVVASQTLDSVYWFEPLWRLGYRGMGPRGVSTNVTTTLLHCDMFDDTNGLPVLPIGRWAGEKFLHHITHGPFSGFKRDENSSIRSRCLSAPLRVVKLVRVDIPTAAQILQENPSTRIIHVIRDPRATAVSQFNAFAANYTLQERVASICNRLTAELDDVRRLFPQLAGRILTVRYEDIVRRPEQELRYLFGWLGLEYTDTITSFLRDRLNCTRNSSFSGCASDSSAEKIINQWRMKLKPKQIDAMTVECSEVLKRISKLRP